MRIAYINLAPSNFKQRSHSILSKINMQAKVAKELGLPFDFYWLPKQTYPGDDRYTHLHIKPVGGGNPISVRLRQCRAIKELIEQYDLLLLRYPLIDPVMFLFLQDTHKIILEHHTKEVPELKVNGDIRLIFEKWMGGSWIKNFRAITAVTPEILDYEVARSGFKGPAGFFPNGIDLDTYPATPVDSSALDPSEPLQLVMVSTTFSPWHGLDALLEQIKSSSNLPPFELHLVGRLKPEMEKKYHDVPEFTLHGTLEREQVLNLYRRMHLGVGSLMFSTIGLTQATPLKVREYLAAGLPIVLGYNDPAIPEGFPFALKQTGFNLMQALEFAESHRQTSRAKIRSAATPFIDSKVITKNLYDFCINT